MRSLNLIHLSDLHIDSESFEEIKQMTHSLCNLLVDFRNERNIDKFDLLVVSGDLVNKGSDSYNLVGKILNLICSAGISNNRVFMVPGNHDVIGFIQDHHGGPQDKLKSNPSFLKTEEDLYSNSLSHLFDKYTSFTKNFPLMIDEDKKFKLQGFAHSKLDIDGLTLNLCGLNSALVAGPNDYNPGGTSKKFEELQNRCCGFDYLSEMIGNNKNELNLIVSHYPLSWIHNFERIKVQGLLQQNKAMLLVGHTHEEAEEASGLIESQLLQLGAGTAYGKKWGGKNSCRIIELPTNQDEVLLHDFIWFGNHGWRAFKPLKAQCAGWSSCRNSLRPDSYRRMSPDHISRVISAFYLNRGYLQNFEDVIKLASNEIFLVCNIGGSLIANLWSSLEQKAIDGCYVKILFANPNCGEKVNPLISLIAEITRHKSLERTLPDNLATVIDRLMELKNLNKKAFRKIEIKLYTSLVTLVILFVDADPKKRTLASRINVELLPHKFLGDERPSFDLNLDQSNELPKKLYRQYKKLWKESKLLILPEKG